MINIYELQPYVHEIARSMRAEVCYTEVKDGRVAFDLRSDIDGHNIGCVGIDLRRCGHIDNAVESLREKISDLIMSRARDQMLTKENHRGKRAEFVCFDEWANFRGAYKNVASVPAIKNVIFNDPATIVIWADDTKTVVKAQNGELFNPEKGLAMAIAKKALGNQGNYYETIKKWVEKYESENCTIEFVNELGEKIASAFGKIGEIKIPNVKFEIKHNQPAPKIDTDVSLIGKMQTPDLDIDIYHSYIDEFISGLVKERTDALEGEFHRRLAEVGLKVVDLRKEGSE